MSDKHRSLLLLSNGSGNKNGTRRANLWLRVYREMVSQCFNGLAVHDREVAQVRHQTTVRLIYASDNKTEKVDAEWLARLGRLDPKLLTPIRDRGTEAQTDLPTNRSRDCPVRSRMQLLVNLFRKASINFWRKSRWSGCDRS